MLCRRAKMMDPQQPNRQPEGPILQRVPSHPPFQESAYPPKPSHIVYIQLSFMNLLPWDYVLVTVAAALALVAYFCLPLVSALGLFSATGVQLSQMASDVQGLWVPVATASVAGAVSGTCLALKPTRRWVRFVTGAIIGVMGVTAIVPLYALYLDAVGKSSTAYLGTGFWLCGIANVGLVIGGIFVTAGE